MDETNEVGSSKLFTTRFFISSEDKKIHKYPIEEEPTHVEHKNETIYEGETALTDLINTEGARDSCPICFKGERAE